MSNLPAVAVSFDEMARLATAVAESGLFGMKTPAQALALMAIAQAEGQHPALAARDYHIIDGRPALKADAMLARFQSSGGKMEMLEYTDAKVAAKFSHPQGGTVTLDWTIERAKQAGIAGKKNWISYPRQMLRARVISEGIRTVFPGATVGLLTPEEAMDAAPEAERDVTPQKAPTGVAALEERIAAMTHQTIIEPVTIDGPLEPGTLVPAGDGEFELTPPSVEDQILVQLRDTALEGTVALQGVWDGLTKEMRRKLQDNLPALKAAAHKVDAEQAAARG